MKPWPEQIAMAEQAHAVLKKYGIVYLACEERTGKSLAAILTVEALTNMQINTVLIITKKKAKKGWDELIPQLTTDKKYVATTYGTAHKHPKPDFVILDEAHNYISSSPKPSATWKTIKPLCANLGIILISATPNAQGYQMLFHQFNLSSFSPWKQYKNFYSWFKVYGKPFTVEINGMDIPQYTRTKEDLVLADVNKYFITKTRKESNFEHEPEDMLHYVELGVSTKAAYNTLLEHNIVEFKAGTLVCDTTSKLRYALHMLEGGTAKLDNQPIILANREKIDYILATWGDNEDVVIMYNYIGEGIKLREVFVRAHILQATSYAEGVDLSMHEHLIIYSQDFSTARHTQRRARQANKHRKTSIIVHFLLVKKATSAQVYKTVSVNKRNFVDSVFTRSRL